MSGSAADGPDAHDGPDAAGTPDAAEPAGTPDAVGAPGAVASGTQVRPDWFAARRRAFEVATPLAAVATPLSEAAGRTLARDVDALTDVPHYASSAMDGWAVSGEGPWMIIPPARVSNPLAAGQAQVIVTGGLVPEGATRVVRSEQGRVVGGAPESLLTEATGAGSAGSRGRDHIRPAGEEAHRGDVVLHAGTLLNPAHIAVAAACGHDSVLAIARPRVMLVLTGDEVQLSGIPRPGFVRDSFGVTLPALVGSLGGDVTGTLRVRDTREALVQALAPVGAPPEPGSPADLIITTGSTGSSHADHLHGALVELGAELIIDRVAMRPGGPTLLARLPDGRLLLGLPGNPLAAMVGLLSLGHPLLAALAGVAAPSESTVVTRDSLIGHPASVLLSPYRLIDGEAVVNDFTGSAMMRGLAEADGILLCPASGAPAGTAVPALPLPWT